MSGEDTERRLWVGGEARHAEKIQESRTEETPQSGIVGRGSEEGSLDTCWFNLMVRALSGHLHTARSIIPALHDKLHTVARPPPLRVHTQKMHTVPHRLHPCALCGVGPLGYCMHSRLVDAIEVNMYLQRTRSWPPTPVRPVSYVRSEKPRSFVNLKPLLPLTPPRTATSKNYEKNPPRVKIPERCERAAEELPFRSKRSLLVLLEVGRAVVHHWANVPVGWRNLSGVRTREMT